MTAPANPDRLGSRHRVGRPFGRRALGASVVVLTILIAAPGCVPTAGARRSGTAPPPASEAPPPPTAPWTPSPTALERDPLSEEEITAAVAAASVPEVVESIVSPDETWRAEILAYDCIDVRPGERYALQELHLLRTDAGPGPAVDSQLIACGGLGASGLAGRFWSPSSRFFYYTDAAHGVPDGCGFWEPPLIRLDAESMRTETLESPVLSPQGDLLAAWNRDQIGVWRLDGPRLVLLDVPTTHTVPGPIAWRPDGSAIAFLVNESSCSLGWADLVRLDLADLRPIVILSYLEPTFADIDWDAPNRVTLTDKDGVRWRYNFLSRDLWPIDP